MPHQGGPLEATPTSAPEAAPAAPPPIAPRKFVLPPDPTPAETPAAPAEAAPAAKPTEAEAPPAKPDEKPETDQDPEQRRGLRRFERRLDKAYRRAAEAQARADLLEKQLREATPAAAVDTAAPTLEKHNYDPEAYAQAKAKYETEKTLREREATGRAEQQKQAQQKLLSQWEEAAEKGSEKYEDFDAVVGKLEPNSPLTVAIMGAENGQDIAYHLGKNLKDAERIAKLPPVQQVFELGRLAAKIAAEPEKPKVPSKAPAPITPLTGATPAASAAAPSEDDDTATWIKKRQRQVHQRR